MCSLYLTHPRAHTPGAVDARTHARMHARTHTPGAVDARTHTHTHTHTWSSGRTHTHTHTYTPGAVDTVHSAVDAQHVHRM